MEYQMSSNRRMQQKQRREALIREGTSGKTIMDTLSNTAYPWTDEAEAMYFKGARVFLQTSLAYHIICGHQDIAGSMED